MTGAVHHGGMFEQELDEATMGGEGAHGAPGGAGVRQSRWRRRLEVEQRRWPS